MGVLTSKIRKETMTNIKIINIMTASRTYEGEGVSCVIRG